MEKQLLNGTDIEISRLSMGTWAFSGISLWGSTDANEAIRVMHHAMDCGINTFDTAAGYGDGESERILSRMLEGRRDKVILASKVQNNFLAYNDVIEQCNGTLQRLGTDYLDIYQIHWPSKVIPFEETFRAFEDLKKDGKIRQISVCNFGPKSLEKARGHKLVMNQLPWSLIWRVIETNGTVEASVQENLPIWTYCALSQGLLTGTYKTVEEVPLTRRANRMYNSKWGQSRHTEEGFEDGIFALLAGLRSLCEETGYSMPELAFGFLKSQSAVGSILFGARTDSQLEENLKAYECQVPAEVIARAKELSEPLRKQMGTNADMFQNEDGGRMF